MKTQEEIFEDIKRVALRIDNLKGFVQNDFQRMIDDGMVTKHDLERGAEECLEQFFQAISELQKAQINSYNLIYSFADKL